MKPTKEHYEKLQNKLIQSEKDLEKAKLDHEIEKKEVIRAEQKLKKLKDQHPLDGFKNLFKKFYGIDIDKKEDDLIDTAYLIING